MCILENRTNLYEMMKSASNSINKSGLLDVKLLMSFTKRSSVQEEHVLESKGITLQKRDIIVPMISRKVQCKYQDLRLAKFMN